MRVMPIDVSGSAVSPVGSVGAGLDWFLDDHVAVGLQARYLCGFGADFEFDGQRRTLSLDALHVQAALTVYSDRLSKGLLRIRNRVQGHHDSGCLVPGTDRSQLR